MVLAVKACPFFCWLWQLFKDFCLGLKEKWQWDKCSGKMEISLRRKNALNIVHFHLGLSDMNRRHRLRQAKDFEFLGSRPYIVTTSQRGRGMEEKN